MHCIGGHLWSEWYLPEDTTEGVKVVVGSLDSDRRNLVEAGASDKLCGRRLEHFRRISASLLPRRRIPTCQLESWRDTGRGGASCCQWSTWIGRPIGGVAQNRSAARNHFCSLFFGEGWRYFISIGISSNKRQRRRHRRRRRRRRRPCAFICNKSANLLFKTSFMPSSLQSKLLTYLLYSHRRHESKKVPSTIGNIILILLWVVLYHLIPERTCLWHPALHHQRQACYPLHYSLLGNKLFIIFQLSLQPVSLQPGTKAVLEPLPSRIQFRGKSCSINVWFIFVQANDRWPRFEPRTYTLKWVAGQL